MTVGKYPVIFDLTCKIEGKDKGMPDARETVQTAGANTIGDVTFTVACPKCSVSQNDNRVPDGNQITRRDFLKEMGVMGAGAFTNPQIDINPALQALWDLTTKTSFPKVDALTALEKKGVRVGDYGLHITTNIGWDTPIDQPQLALAAHNTAEKLELGERGKERVMKALSPEDATIGEQFISLRLHSDLNRDSIETFIPYETLDTLQISADVKDDLAKLKALKRNDIVAKFSQSVSAIASHYHDINPVSAKQVFTRAFNNEATDDDIAYLAQIAAKPDAKNFLVLPGAESGLRNGELRFLPPAALARMAETIFRGNDEQAKRIITDEFLKQLPMQLRRVVIARMAETADREVSFDIFTRLDTQDAIVMLPAFSQESKRYISQHVLQEVFTNMLSSAAQGSMPSNAAADDKQRFAPISVYPRDVFDAQTLVNTLSTEASAEKLAQVITQLESKGEEEKVRYIFDAMDRLHLDDTKSSVLSYILEKSTNITGDDNYFPVLMTELTRSEKCDDFDHEQCKDLLDRLYTRVRKTADEQVNIWEKKFASVTCHHMERFFETAHEHENYSLALAVSGFIDADNPGNRDSFGNRLGFTDTVAPVFDGFAQFLNKLMESEEGKKDAANYLSFVYENDPLIFTALLMDGLQAKAAAPVVDLLKDAIAPDELLANMLMYYITRGSDSPLRDVFLGLMKDKLAPTLLGLFSSVQGDDLTQKLKTVVGVGNGKYMDLILREYLPATAQGTLHLSVDGNTKVYLEATGESLPLKELFTFSDFDGKVVAIDGEGVLVRFNPASQIYPDHDKSPAEALRRYTVAAPNGWLNFGTPDQRMRENLQKALAGGEIFRIRWGPTDLAANVNLMHGLKHLPDDEFEAEIPHFAALLFSMLLARTDKHAAIDTWSKLTNEYLTLPSGSLVTGANMQKGGKNLDIDSRYGIRPYRYEIDDAGVGSLVCEITSLGHSHGDFRIGGKQFLKAFDSTTRPIIGSEELMFLLMSEMAFSTAIVTKVAPVALILAAKGAKQGAEFGIATLLISGKLTARGIRWGIGKILSGAARRTEEIARAPQTGQITKGGFEALRDVLQERKMVEAAQRIEREAQAVLQAKRDGEILQNVEQVAKLNIERAKQVQDLIAQANKAREKAQIDSVRIIADALDEANTIIRQAETEAATIREVANKVLQAVKATSVREQWLNNLATQKDRIITEIGEEVVKIGKELIDDLRRLQKRISGKTSLRPNSTLFQFPS